MTDNKAEEIKVELQRIGDTLDAIMIALADHMKRSEQKPAQSSSSGGGRKSNTVAPTVFPNYGRSKGAPIAGASKEDLDYYANGARRSLADPEKSKWHANERALLEAIEAEVKRHAGAPAPQDEWGPPPPGFDEPARSPAPSDDDIPF